LLTFVDNFWQLKTSKITSFFRVLNFLKISLCGEISPVLKKNEKKKKMLIMTVNKESSVSFF
jgi:hypothetical protein